MSGSGMVPADSPAGTGESEKPARLHYLDWLRVLLILGVFLYHALHPFDSTIRLSKMFRAAVEKSGLRPIPLRQLRHSHATVLLRSGAHPKVAQDRLGHSSVKVTLDTYSAVIPNMQKEAIEELARLFDAG